MPVTVLQSHVSQQIWNQKAFKKSNQFCKHLPKLSQRADSLGTICAANHSWNIRIEETGLLKLQNLYKVTVKMITETIIFLAMLTTE
jgi:hypothetical protein